MLDAQMKRGLLDACVLSVLERQDSYGYRIVRELSGCIEVSESTLYPILRRLEGGGALTTYSVEHGGRLRKFYRITPEGRRQLSAARKDWEEILRIYEFIRGEGEGHDEG